MYRFVGVHPTALLALALTASTLHAQVPEAAPAEASMRAAANTAAVTNQTVSVSSVRIVRLSEIRGEAQLDRNTGAGFETAFTNLPIVQNAKLRTTAGVAEVEFEDNSSLRLTPGTTVDFPQLGRTSTGATLSTIRLLKGTIYVSLAGSRPKTSPNQVTVTFGSPGALQTLTIAPSSHIELALDSPVAKLSVFDGSVDVQHDGVTTATVVKKKQLVFDPGNPTAPTTLTKVEKGPFDDWDKDQADYHKRYANAAFGLTSSYGISDLNYYGSFASLPGCGNAWRPYFASAAWDPFANGTWAYYPGAGYSWVSPYPWGWTPFHFGSWQQCGAAGWGWQPGGQWLGLQNIAVVPTSGGGSNLTNIHPKPPAGSPTAVHPSMLVVSNRPLSVSRLAAADTFVFSKDSAGLGVPRQTFGNLSGASRDVAHHGALTTSVFATPGVGEAGRTSIPNVHTVHPAYSMGPAAQGYTTFPGGTPEPGLAHPTSHSTSNGSPSSGWGGTGGTVHGTAPSSGGSTPSPTAAPSSHR